MNSFTAEDKRKCAEREVAMRRTVYPGRVAAKRMRQETADREIAIMEAIAKDYRTQEAQQPAAVVPQQRLDF